MIIGIQSPEGEVQRPEGGVQSPEEKVAETYYKLCAASKENSEILLTSEFEYLLRIEYNRLGVSIEDFKSWREGGGAYDDNHIHESWKVSSYACVYMHMYI